MKTPVKYPRITLALLALSILNFQLSTVFAQGTAFTYQARLNDGASAASGIYDLRFAIYDSVSAGTLIAGPVTNSTTGVSNGLFTVMLDFGAAPFNGSARWLEIGVRTNGGSGFSILNPRQQITPSPYAVFANTASNLSGTVSPSQLSGTIPLGQLPGAVVTNGASGVNIVGSFTGDGSALTNIQPSAIGPAGTINLLSVPLYFKQTTYVVGNSPRAVVAIDVNADDKADLVSANSGNTLTVLTNNGSGDFGSNALLTVGVGVLSVVAADVNGDGKKDLISANFDDNTLTVLTNNGSGIFGFNATLNVGDEPVFVAAADVNGDGKEDLISANFNDNTLTVLTNNASGIFEFDDTLHVGNFPYCVAAADVNGDGKKDLISANEFANTLTVLTNDGSGIFGFNATLNVGNGPVSVIAADVNGDGKEDLISANGATNTLTVLTNNGSGIFGLNAMLNVGNGPVSVIAADVNGDGKEDLISANQVANTLTVLTNNGSGVFGFIARPGAGNGPVSVIAADVNGDDKQDLITANSGGNTLTVLLESSQALSTADAVSFVNSANSFAGSFGVSPGGSLCLNDQPLYLRSNNDNNHGLAYAGNGIHNFGPTVQPNGPVLWGFAGGVLGTTVSGQQAVLSWDSDGVTVNGTINGNGSGVTNLDASQLKNGTVPDARLSGTYSSALTFNNAGNSFSGNGANLTSLNANNLASGTVPLARMPAQVVTNNAAGVTLNNLNLNSTNALGASFYAQGNRTNGWQNSIGWFENTSTATNAAPALRVFVDSGARTPDGALSVSANVTASSPNSLIAEFGNASSFVVTITNDGTIYSKGLALTSDRNAKTNFTTLDATAVLAKVTALPVTRWNYKEDSTTKRHIGPVAQDFHSAFGLNGDDDTHISVVDESGVALAAIQGLNQKLNEKDEEIRDLKRQNDSLAKELNHLESVVESLVNRK